MNQSKKRSNRIYFAITAIALVLALILCIDYGIRRSAEKSAADETATTRTQIEKRDKVKISVSTESIRDGLADMGFLITQEYYFTQVEEYSKERKILFLTALSEFTYSYDGAVLAGVDFEKIQIEKDEDRNLITVEMPDSEIRAVTIDKDTFKIYSEKDSLWNPLKLEDYNVSLAEFENAAKKKAIESGILERSDEQAKRLVKGFIENLPSASGYAIEFR